MRHGVHSKKNEAILGKNKFGIGSGWEMRSPLAKELTQKLY